MSHSAKAATVGEIARRLGVPLHRVEYVIRSRNLPAKSRAGNVRVFDEDDVRLIRAELVDIDRRKPSSFQADGSRE